MDFNTGLSILGIGIGIVMELLGMRPMHWALKWGLYSFGGVLIVVGVWGVFRGLGSELHSEKPSVSITQTNPQSSPNVIGDDNRVIINPDQVRRITKREEFVRALRTVGPVTIGLETFQDRDALFLYGQLYKLLEDSKWTANERATVSGQSWVGVHVVIQKDKAIPHGAIEMVKQLRANGIGAGLVPEQNPALFEKVAFVVRIGLRAPSNNE